MYTEILKKVNEDVRALNLELIDEAPIEGYWIYKITLTRNGEIEEEHIMGKDMSDALFRFSTLNNTQLVQFKYKNHEKNKNS